jgi:rare lipoprotein A
MRAGRVRLSLWRNMSVSCSGWGRGAGAVLWSPQVCGIAGVAGLVMLAGCAPPPQQRIGTASKEYFSSKIYGPASPRVVADGEPVPRGGGQYLVGHPYTIAGKTYYPSEKASGYSAVGMASWYGDAFHGRRTANGEVYDKMSFSAAHPTMPLPSYARVTNLANNHSIIVRVNDRGPYHGGRVMDVSQRVAEALEFKNIGTARVRVDYVGKAELEGTDDQLLLASLRTDGTLATIGGSAGPAPVLVAEHSAPPVRPAPRNQPHAPDEAVDVAEAKPDALSANLPPANLPATGPVPPVRPFDLGAIRSVIAAAQPRSPAPPQSTIARTNAPDEIPPALVPVTTHAGRNQPAQDGVSALYFAPALLGPVDRASPFDQLGRLEGGGLKR